MTYVHLQDAPQQEGGEEEEVEEEVLDSRGIPGWDRVEKLARALIDLAGLAVTITQAALIKSLYDELLPFDHKPLEFRIRYRAPSRGRFGRSKSGHLGVDQMKRLVRNDKSFFCLFLQVLSLCRVPCLLSKQEQGGRGTVHNAMPEVSRTQKGSKGVLREASLYFPMEARSFRVPG